MIGAKKITFNRYCICDTQEETGQTIQSLICIKIILVLLILQQVVHQTYLTHQFYFVTSDFRVYKVLDNNGGLHIVEQNLRQSQHLHLS